MTEATFTAGMLVGIFLAIPALLVAEHVAPAWLDRLATRLKEGWGPRDR